MKTFQRSKKWTNTCKINKKKKTIKSLTVSVVKIILKATTMNKKLGGKKWNYDNYYVCEKEYYCV